MRRDERGVLISVDAVPWYQVIRIGGLFCSVIPSNTERGGGCNAKMLRDYDEGHRIPRTEVPSVIYLYQIQNVLTSPSPL